MLAQTWKTLNHYIYEQYNTIWKKGKLGVWNNIRKQQKPTTILPINKTSNVIKQQFIKKIALEKKTFYDKFKYLLTSEQKTIMQIKPAMIGGKNNGNH